MTGVKQGYPRSGRRRAHGGGHSRSGSRRAGATNRARSSGAVKGQTIEYWASNQGATIDQDKQVINEAIARFKKESGVTVKFKVIPWADLWNNITTATTSGKGPDVLNIGNTWSASLQATGAFMPFDDDTLKTIGGKDKFLETSYSASGAPGKSRHPCRSTASPTRSSTTRSCSRTPASSRPRRGPSSSTRRRS